MRQTPDCQKRSVHLTEALVREHQTRVWRYLRFLGCPPSVADDLTQETFLTLLQNEPEDRGSAATAAWLRGVARNLVRARHRQLRDGLKLLDHEELEQAFLRYVRADDGGSYHDALRACLETLLDKERAAVHLRYRDSSSRDEIAKKLSVGNEGAKTLLRRAKDKLRLCIEGRLGDEQA